MLHEAAVISGQRTQREWKERGVKLDASLFSPDFGLLKKAVL